SGKGRLWHEISMLPTPDAAVAAYLKLQPGLRRLAIFWTAYPGERYLEELRQAGKAAGLEIISARLRGPDAFPERLRYLLSRMDAFWLMPDPALITQSSLLVLANFSCANSIPFYAPTRALVASGATASFAPDFKAAGAAAARGIALMRSGQQLPAVTYVENPQLQLNTELTEKCRWPIKIK
ncbi:MAG: hypothetical protein HY952_05115, partial [Elusimicrobia bacterium]|nr:hypothetical protein [Elusimicrobiota bacterium]